MLRTFFSAIGVLASALVLFCASFLFNVATGLDAAHDAYVHAAVDTTRDLARTWTLSSIEQRYAADARQELLPVLDGRLDELAGLGPLLEASSVRTQPRWSELPNARPDTRTFSIGEVADRVAALLNRSVKVTFTGTFAGGIAKISAELKREGRALKLWRLRIETTGPLRPPEPRERQVISHA